MKFFKHKPLVLAAALGALLTAGVADLSNAAPNNISVNVSVEQSAITEGVDQSHGANWNGGKGVSMTRLAAITDAQRHLLGIIKGVQIDADTLMNDLIIENDTVRTKISGLLRGAQIIEEKQLENDEYSVKMCVPLYGATGSLASVIVPEIMDRGTPEPFPEVDPTALTEAEMQSIRDANYTGVVINADGLGMDPTFSPVIYDTDGRAVYGVKNLEYDTVIEKGMVDYADDLNGAAADGRAGDNPLVIDAVDVSGGQNSVNRVNAVVSVKDANKILLANESTDMLEDTSVVFVK